MKVSVCLVTYRRSWALRYSLGSIASQSRRPDEVVVVLKPSGDGSEDVINEFSEHLPIRVVIQREGNVTDAVEMAIRNASGDVVLFLDDDAVASHDWIAKYESLFSSLPDAGGISGMTLRAEIEDGKLNLTGVPFYLFNPTKPIFYRKPLPEFHDYYGWISISGFMGAKRIDAENGVVKYGLLGGVNMGWRREAVAGCPLSKLYRRSKRGLWFEQLLAFCARKRGYHTYLALGDASPVVWHIAHQSSLTRGRGFWHEFWIHYDRVAMYWRLKKLGAKLSFTAYLAVLLAMMRRRPLPRLFATIYGLTVRV